MHLAKISSQNQITIPVGIMRQLGLKQADRVVVTVEQDKIVLVPQEESVVEELAGSLDEYVAEDKKGKSWEKIKEEADRLRLEEYRKKRKKQ